MSAPVPQGPRDSTGQKGKGTGRLLYHTVTELGTSLVAQW